MIEGELSKRFLVELTLQFCIDLGYQIKYFRGANKYRQTTTFSLLVVSECEYDMCLDTIKLQFLFDDTGKIEKLSYLLMAPKFATIM